jgi:hypothetical protein
MLEQEREGNEQTWGRLAAVMGGLRWRRVDLGANSKFASSGEGLLAISGGWVEDDLAELVGASIYRALRR